MPKRRILFPTFLLAVLCLAPGAALAQQKEAPISNREIAERLLRLEEGQKALAQRLEDVNTNLSKRIEEVNTNLGKRIEDVNTNLSKRIEDVNTNLSKRIEDGNASLNKRIDDLRVEMNNRFDDLMAFQQITVSALIALVLAIAGAGFVMWRKILQVDAAVQTTIGLDQAVSNRVSHLEQEIGFVKGKLHELSVTVDNMAKGRG
jgi:chaperonin cofactor prefoldin